MTPNKKLPGRKHLLQYARALETQTRALSVLQLIAKNTTGAAQRSLPPSRAWLHFRLSLQLTRRIRTAASRLPEPKPGATCGFSAFSAKCERNGPFCSAPAGPGDLRAGPADLRAGPRMREPGPAGEDSAGLGLAGSACSGGSSVRVNCSPRCREGAEASSRRPGNVDTAPAGCSPAGPGSQET